MFDKSHFVKTILFLGYDSSKTKIIDSIRKLGVRVIHQDKKEIEESKFESVDLVISFGYRHLLSETIVEKYSPIINLHVSYLPFNRGSFANFWSFYDETQSGVSIHLIDKGIDTGDILYQKKIDFDPKKMTFRETYNILLEQIEKLFLDNISQILSLKYPLIKQSHKGTYHHSKDFPSEFRGWDENIDKEINRLKNLRKKN
tara:strand:- start:1315 stop:1917 length:603 start_codon:yes stop_codon:yes gene_type:complete